jgi:hypothetical protein
MAETYCDLTGCTQRVRSGVELSGSRRELWKLCTFYELSL